MPSAQQITDLPCQIKVTHPSETCVTCASSFNTSIDKFCVNTIKHLSFVQILFVLKPTCEGSPQPFGQVNQTMGPQHHKMRQWNFPKQPPDIFFHSQPSSKSARGRAPCEVKTVQPELQTKQQKTSKHHQPKVTLSGSRPTKGMATKKEYQRQMMKAPTKEARHIIQGEISNQGINEKPTKIPARARSNLVSKAGVEL